jgi:hypothetical protein
LGPDDRVAPEVTGNAWEIARIIERHVAQVLLVSHSDKRRDRLQPCHLQARTNAVRLSACRRLGATGGSSTPRGSS